MRRGKTRTLAIMNLRAASLDRAVMIGAPLHAVALMILWLGPMYWGVQMLSAQVWVICAWTWLLWPVLLLSTSARSSRVAIFGVVVGGLALLPASREIYIFTGWIVGRLTS
jgi:hypothetical protein